VSSLPIFGTTAVRLHAGRKLHNVRTEVVFASLLADCVTFLAPGWYACVMLEDGQGWMRGRLDTTRQPAQDVRDKLFAVAVMLNREHHQGGHWVTAWAGGRMHMLWRDKDGDLQFTFEIDEPWVRVRAWPDTEFSDRATKGYDQWVEHMKAMVFRSNEQFRRALGEQAPSSMMTH